ncbi:hypothetical protein GCM10010521_75410 [Streptomyces rameus]|uniref:Uncharacterized protein n=1 Tax=Streptomyces rameus TaxID=68261 RepID=A0ABP6HQX9_9ACTN
MADCTVDHFYQPPQPYRGRLGVLFVSAASAEAAGRGVLTAVRSLLGRPQDRARAVLRLPPPDHPTSLCHGIVSVPARILL